MNIEDFNYRDFANKLDYSRKQALNIKYECCVPGCDCNAINSHLVSKATLKHFLCGKDNKLIQCQIDQIHPMSVLSTRELPFEKFVSLGINDAMSMPIFCKKHDNDLFSKYEEDIDSSVPEDIEFQLLQALRIIGAQHNYNEKLLNETIFLNEKEGCLYHCYNEQIQYYKNLQRRYKSTLSLLYKSIINANYNEYTFKCMKFDTMRLSICDAIVDNEDIENNICDDDFNEPFKVLYVILIPKKEHSYLILGYHKSYMSDWLTSRMNDWVNKFNLKTTYKTIYNILCYCTNNWCISTDCDRRIIKFLEDNYSEDRINVRFDNV